MVDLDAVGGNRLLTEPRRLAAVRDRPNAARFAVAAVCIGAFMGQLDASIVTLAFPTLERSFHTGLGEVTWVGLSYLLVLVATVTAVGRFADMAGRKLLYLYGFAVFIIGSALCGFAPDLPVLIAFRVLQAIGAAMLQANSVAIITVAVPRRALGRSLGVQGAAQALGLALGPTVGGLLLAGGGWRWIFLVNVPVGLIGIVAGWLFIPRSRELQERRPFDWTGLALFFPAVVALLSAISFGNEQGWNSPLIIAAFVAAALLGTAFVASERRAGAPMVSLDLFRRAPFTLGIVSGLLSFVVLFGVLLAVPFLLERGLGLGTGRAGLELMAMPLALGVVAPLAGRWSDRLSARTLTVGGMSLVAGSLVALAVTTRSASALPICLAGVGAGLGLFTPTNNAAIMGSVARIDAGLASGLLNMTRGLGTALGLAVTGLVFGAAGGVTGAAGTRHAFVVVAVFLAAVAVVAVLVSLVRGSTELVNDRSLTAE